MLPFKWGSWGLASDSFSPSKFKTQRAPTVAGPSSSPCLIREVDTTEHNTACGPRITKEWTAFGVREAGGGRFGGKEAGAPCLEMRPQASDMWPPDESASAQVMRTQWDVNLLQKTLGKDSSLMWLFWEMKEPGKRRDTQKIFQLSESDRRTSISLHTSAVRFKGILSFQDSEWVGPGSGYRCCQPFTPWMSRLLFGSAPIHSFISLFLRQSRFHVWPSELRVVIPSVSHPLPPRCTKTVTAIRCWLFPQSRMRVHTPSPSLAEDSEQSSNRLKGRWGIGENLLSLMRCVNCGCSWLLYSLGGAPWSLQSLSEDINPLLLTR